MVLLHVMNALKAEIPQLQLTAVYVHHDLSLHANEWQAFCEQLCNELAITFYAAQVKIDRKTRTSLEQQARDARYQALDQLSPSGKYYFARATLK